jgi:hypothetical protein
MVRFGRTLPLVAALLVAAAWATPPPARADFQLRIYEDLGSGNVATATPLLTLSDTSGSGVIQYSGNVGDFNLAFTYATTNSPGGDTGIVTVSNTRITNRTGAAHEITIAVSSQGFTSPSGANLTLENSSSGTVQRGTVTGDFTSFVDRQNGLFGVSDLSSSAFTYSGVAGTDSASFAGTTFNGYLPELGPVYSITNVGDYNFSGGASVTLTGGLSEVHAPAPPGLVLALSGVPLLSVGYWFRRRRAPA